MAGKKEIGIIGKVELDLAIFKRDDYNNVKLMLGSCEYEGAFIEVGVKGTESKGNTSSGNLNATAISPLNHSMSSSIMDSQLENVSYNQAL